MENYANCGLHNRYGALEFAENYVEVNNIFYRMV